MEKTIKVVILEWDVIAMQVKMKDNNGVLYYLENCTPPDGLMLGITLHRYNTVGQLIKKDYQLGPWVLHSNENTEGSEGVLNKWGE
jgi:hypothetical protein